MNHINTKQRKTYIYIYILKSSGLDQEYLCFHPAFCTDDTIIAFPEITCVRFASHAEHMSNANVPPTD